MAYFKLNTDGTIQSANKEHDGFLPLSLLGTKEDGSLFTYYKLVDGKYIGDLEAEQADLDAQALADSKNIGQTYTLNDTDYLVSFQKNDADGLLQVKAGFELGLTDTVIHFENGTKMPIQATEFGEFALWFVQKRNSFFKAD